MPLPLCRETWRKIGSVLPGSAFAGTELQTGSLRPPEPFRWHKNAEVSADKRWTGEEKRQLKIVLLTDPGRSGPIPKYVHARISWRKEVQSAHHCECTLSFQDSQKR